MLCHLPAFRQERRPAPSSHHAKPPFEIAPGVFVEAPNPRESGTNWEQHGSIRTKLRGTGRSGWWLDLVKDQGRPSVRRLPAGKVGGELGDQGGPRLRGLGQAGADRPGACGPGTASADAARRSGALGSGRNAGAAPGERDLAPRRALFFFAAELGPPVILVVGLHRGPAGEPSSGGRGRPAGRWRQAGGGDSRPSGYYAGGGARPAAGQERSAMAAPIAGRKQILRRVQGQAGRAVRRVGRVWDQLNREGIPGRPRCNCRAASCGRLGACAGVRRPGGLQGAHGTPPGPRRKARPEDLVNRDFAPDAPDRAVGSGTSPSCPPGRATAYTALVIDAFLPGLIGRVAHTPPSHSTDLVLDAAGDWRSTYRARHGRQGWPGPDPPQRRRQRVPVDPVTAPELAGRGANRARPVRVRRRCPMTTRWPRASVRAV